MHTPGPWTADIDNCDIDDDCDDDGITGWINRLDGEPVVKYAGCGTHHADWPNPDDKQLALAAPGLYEAMKDAMPYLEGTLGPCELDCGCLLHSFRAALEKAEGK